MGTLNPHFGIGLATEIDSVIVRWPSGKKDVICNPEINNTLFIEEGSGVLPVAEFTVSDNIITPGEIVSFTDASTTLCPMSWAWSVQPPIGFSFINGTNATSQNPEIQFNNFGIYNVFLVVTNGNGASENVPTEQINVVSDLGLNDTQPQLLFIYPNPTTSGQLNIEYSANIENAHLAVVSTIGSEVMRFDSTPNSIDVNALSNGTYFLVILLPNGEKHTKLFVKQ